jgi:Tfp pilus assembly protein PilF
MSVILDALRRARGGRAPDTKAQARADALSGVPAALGLSRVGRAAPAESGRPRPVVIALVLLIAAGVWAAIKYSMPPAADSPGGGPNAAPPAIASPPSPPPPVEDVSPPVDVPVVVESEPGALPRTGRVRRRAAAPSAMPRAGAPPPAQAQASPPPPANGPAQAGAAGARANHFELALRYHSLGDFEQALQHYLAVLQEEEFHAEARNNLGLLYHQRGLHPEAIEQFRRALIVNPAYLKARSNLAVALTSAGRLPEARAELRAALSIEPRNVDLLVNLALVEKADSQPDEAIEVLLRALAVQPTHAMANYNVAVLYEEKAALARAYDHYAAFLKHAGPEHGALLASVQARVQQLKGQLSVADAAVR